MIKIKCGQIILGVLLICGQSRLTLAQTFQVEKGSKINFTAVGKPGFLRINGETTEILGQLNLDKLSLSGEIIMKIAMIDTGIKMRDEHMKEKYLEEKKFPEAKLTFTHFKITSLEEKDLKWTGKLSLHGKEKEISGEAELKCKDTKNCQVQAKFPLILEDFNIEIPTYAGITVAKKVEVEAQIKFSEVVKKESKT